MLIGLAENSTVERIRTRSSRINLGKSCNNNFRVE